MSGLFPLLSISVISMEFVPYHELQAPVAIKIMFGTQPPIQLL